MTNKTLKIIAGFALVLSLATPALAVAPLVLSAIELAAPVVIAAGVSFLMPSSATSNLPKTGYADNYGVRRPMLARVGTTAALAVTGYMAYDELRSLVNASPTSYPALSSAIRTQTNAPIALSGTTNNLSGLTVGSYMTYNGTTYKLTSVSSEMLYCTVGNYSCYDVDRQFLSYGYYIDVYGPYAKQYNFSVAQPPAPIYTDTPDSVLASTLGLDSLYPQYQTDVDNLIINNPDKLQLPATIANDVTSAAKQLASDTQKQASAARVASLKEVRDARQAAYDANPTPENKEALDKAEAEYQEALADDSELSLESIKDAEADSPLTPPEPPEYDTINFQPLVDMGEELGDKFPFSLLATLKNFATGLVTTPRAPAFDITFPAPFNHTWHVSLDRFDGIAQMVRVLIGMAFLGYCTMAIIRRWQ